VHADLGALAARYHRAFNDRDFDCWREVFDEDVELLIDGVPFRGVDAAVAYGVGSVSQFPGLYIASERIVSESGDTIVTEIDLVSGDPASGQSRPVGTSCEISRVRDGRIVSVRSYYMPEPADRVEAVRVPVRAEAGVVAEEQAALRRVAMLVARGAAQEELFATVTEQTGWLVKADTTSLLRFESDDTVTLVAAWSARQDDLPLGSSRPVDEELRSIRETGRPWRREPADLPPSGTFVEEARALGMRTFVGVPIVVEGRTWGVVFASSTADRPFADDAERRLTGFTELVATAIANAHARGELSAFVEEQAALRRVATLVATGAPPAEVFTAVAAEVGQLLRVDYTVLVRSDSQDMITVAGTWTRIGGGAPSPVGSRFELGGRNVSTLVLRTGRPARLDAYADVTGTIGNTGARDWGFGSSAGVPISVEGRLWGLIIVAYARDHPLPTGTEARLAGFTELVGTAIANTQARVELRGFADEQAALRRVATLVARAAAPDEVFAAVAAEVGRLPGCDITFLNRYDLDHAATAVGIWSSTGALPFPVGTRVHLGGRNVPTLVFQTHRPARIDNYTHATGPVADVADAWGIRSAVGVPISVEDRLWGVMSVVSTREEPLPADTELRLAGFTELVGTAIANAQARVELGGYAEEQAALRRVATLVARAAAPDEVFAAVTAEAGQLLAVDFTFLSRYDAEGTVMVVGGWNNTNDSVPVPVGSRLTVGGQNVHTLVYETHRPARTDRADASGPAAEVFHGRGIRSCVGAPISVEGRLWGVMGVAYTREEPLPADTELRLAGFTELVATAIANAQARVELRGYAEEQTALRRVATLVARAAAPEDMFAAVTAEVGRVLTADVTGMIRYNTDGTASIVGAWSSTGASPLVVGTRAQLSGPSVTTLVFETGRPARIDDLSATSGELAALARERGVRSAVGVPISVEGRPWGVMMVASVSEQPQPADTEVRLSGFTDLIATAIANAQIRAELLASRARIVAASDEARRRIERDLHDGAQQRLVALALLLRSAAGRPDSDEIHTAVVDAADGLMGAIDDLREISQGIHPAILSRAGLRPALRALVRRSPIPVEIDVRIDGRLPEPVEVGAYYVVSEMLTNAAKHARASIVEVDAETSGGTLRLYVRDDGVGGADPLRGSGLVGLKDRIEALGGTLTLHSPAGAGTTVTCELPVSPGTDHGIQSRPGQE
jgi:GAF domain-containing protein